ncbi:carbohydrate ABC transporter permease [Curtobacterium sp. Leaf261]|uniref:carbohydrate ABC transporter permease n=1 Tax=Curtobacterium sp. Leaf261 TaxID=1736311 RepID=UPI0009EAB303|nr:sugar ABC transporter permease [Curtobacterium sp. Leaf261]
MSAAVGPTAASGRRDAGAQAGPDGQTSAQALAVRTAVRRKQRWRERRTILVLLSPGLVGLAVFFLYPLAANVFYSFTRYNLIDAASWAGLANYRFMFDGDHQIGPALRNTVLFCLVAVPIQLLFALGVTAVLARIRSGAGVYRPLFYLPTLLPPVAATLAFTFVLNPGTGPVNTVLKAIGVPQPLWFNSPTWSKTALLLLTMWGIGNTIVILLAATLDVPEELQEAAQLDGANGRQRYWHITLPTIAPVLLFSTIIGVIQSLQLFTQPYVVSTILGSGSGTTANNLGYPQNSMLFFTEVLYQQGFRYFNMGYASALSVVLFVATLVVTGVLILVTRRQMNAERD